MEKKEAKKKEKREEEEEEEEEETETESTTEGDDPLKKSEVYKIHEKEDKPKPVLEYYFMISSKAFLDKNKFPNVHIEKKKYWTVKTDTHNFRINDSFKKQKEHDKKKQPNDKFFYFRLSGLNLYYTNTDTDINVLGVISVKSMDKIMKPEQDASTEYITTCFVLTSIENIKYKMCGMEEKTVKHWYCQIKSFLGQQDMEICMKDGDGNTKVITKVIEITKPIVIVPTETPHCNTRWNYQKFGDDWECDCSEGKQQSPIDLPKKDEAIVTDVAPLFRYNKVKAKDQEATVDETYAANENTLRIELKENLLRVFHPDFGRLITVDGSVYSAEEINIHTPAEHTIDGEQYDLEVSILHFGISKGDIAKHATVNFLFEKYPGVENPFLEDLDYYELPSPLKKRHDIKEMVYINKINNKPEDVGDITSLQPFSFYTYQGSLTFPPCTENTITYVSSQVLRIGSTALQLFQESTRVPDMTDHKGNIILSDWRPETARKTQALNGRPVFHHVPSEECQRPNGDKVDPGHYEKIRKSFTSYFYVNNQKPSGMPNAYVVSESEAKGNGDRPKPTGKVSYAQ